MRRMACLFLVLLLGVLSVRVQPAAAQSIADQRWIDQLKKTPVDQIEAGLSGTRFADWFAERIKPSEAGYEVKDCQDTPAAAPNQDRFLCVFAYTKPLVPGWNRGIQLNFVVGVFPRSAKGPAEARPVPCRFVIGRDGPSNPQMKRPTSLIFKLSDFEKRYPATRPNSE
jgi:hypothetical protein